MYKKYVVWFDEVDKNSVGLVGGKGANLGEMVNAGLPIPYGFIVTSHAYFYFIKKANLEKKIRDLLSIINYESPNELRQVGTHIRNLILQSEIPHDLEKVIVDYYERFSEKEEKQFDKKPSFFRLGLKKIKHAYRPPLVAIRSSATAEDLPSASFAGQQETYLNIKGENNLLNKIRRCWASLFTERAIYYRHEQKFDHFKVGLAAVVQRMVESDKSGIAFSIDPVTNDKSKMVIEAIYGLGEYIVGGKVTPDHYEVDKKSFIILKKENKYQQAKLVKSYTENKEIKLGRKEGLAVKLNDQEIIRVALLVKQIEDHYYFPQDIEWAIEGNRVFIVQSRPITTIAKTAGVKSQTVTGNKDVITIGSPASPGIGAGPAKIIFKPAEIDRIKKGDVLVAPQTNPDYVPAMKKAAAIVTEKGGRTSHAAIVSRELGIPAVVGADNVTKIVKNEMFISVNGATGEVFKGNILGPNQRSKNGSDIGNADIKKSKQEVFRKKLRTVTKVYVNLAEPEQAEKVSLLDVDGIGLLRAEFMIAEIGVHPKEFIKQKKQSVFVNRLTRDLMKFVTPFSPRPVVYRATDFKTNEYRHLSGGQAYEPHEENPMLGFRGASRYTMTPDVFGMELEAIRNVWIKGFRNLHLMIPFVRVPWELIKIKEIVKNYGLLDLPGFKLWIMVEVPACALNLDEFIKIGIDGVSIGTNDLTMMLLGVDRDNQEVANIYDERNPVVIDTLKKIVSTCSKSGVTCSICGQAASDYPEIIGPLIESGITSVSVTPDVALRTRHLIYEIESKRFDEIRKIKGK
jgi:pyruvate,water dikinase